MQDFRDEGKEILEVIEKYFPKRFDGRESILWLHKYSSQKKQTEWAAFFFEDYCFSLVTHFLGGWKGPRITPSKRFDYQRNFVWDLKLESTHSINGRKTTWIALNDITATKRVINQESGIGYIIARVNFTYDQNRDLKRWRDRLEGRTTRGQNSRMLKKHGRITDLSAVFIKNKSQLNRGISEGWIGIFNQGRNIDGTPRKPKYKIRLDDVPEEFIIKLP